VDLVGHLEQGVLDRLLGVLAIRQELGHPALHLRPDRLQDLWKD
jgi:hypothetical protein